MKTSNENSYYERGSAKPKQVTSATFRKLAERNLLTVNSNRLLIVLVGLPGRGKSFIARKLQAYFSWQCIPCKIFNVGKYRRLASAEGKNADPTFFDSKNKAALKLRNEVAMLALEETLDWLDRKEDEIRLNGREASVRNLSNSVTSDSGNSWNEFGIKSKIAIFDATNSTKSRREAIIQKCTSYEVEHDKPIGIVFIESICDDQEILEENYRMKISVSPDYENMSEEEALIDIKERTRKYEEQYETIDDDSLSYIKIFNLSSKLLANLVYGRMSKAVVPALMAWHIGNRPIYLCRAGKTKEVQGKNPNEVRLVRNGRLDSEGMQFRDNLSSFFYKETMDFLKEQESSSHNTQLFHTGTSLFGGRKTVIDAFHCPGKIMCSTMPRALETACWEELSIPIDILSNLNPLDKGDFTGRELAEIKKIDSLWYSMLERDPYYTRFPGGECYHDLINRLESVVIDMEQQVVPVLVVSHVSVLQVLLSYFRNTPIEKCTSIEVPMNTVIKLIPADGGGWKEVQYPLIKENKKDENPLTSSPLINSPIWTDFSNSVRFNGF